MCVSICHMMGITVQMRMYFMCTCSVCRVNVWYVLCVLVGYIYDNDPVYSARALGASVCGTDLLRCLGDGLH